MLTEIFEGILRMSLYGLTAGILAVVMSLLFRRLRVSKSICFLLWAVTAVRLICPYRLPSPFKTLEDRPAIQTVSREVAGKVPTDTADWNSVGWKDDEEKIGNYKTADYKRQNSVFQQVSESSIWIAWKLLWMKYESFLAGVWLLGTVMFWGYGGLSWILFRKRLKFAIRLEQGIYEVDTIASSCVFGLAKPRIYLTPHLTERQREYILCHERAHISHHDQVWKLAAFVLMGLHWFNIPLWGLYRIFRDELERYCDEQVVRCFGEESKEDYSEVLLEMAVKRSYFSFHSLSFGGNSGKRILKDRINQILRYQKPVKKVQTALFLICAVMGIVLLTGENVRGEENMEKAEKTKAEELYELRNPYVGDASRDGALLGELKEYLPDKNITMELETTKEPYIFRLVLEDPPVTGVKAGDSETDLEGNLTKNAAVLLALIDNLGEVQWKYPAGEKQGETEGSCTLRDLEERYGIKDIKAYGKSPERVQELLDLLGLGETENSTGYSDSVSYIGGADGPTAVFIAGKYAYDTIENAVQSQLDKHLRKEETEGITVIAYEPYTCRTIEDGLVEVPVFYLAEVCAVGEGPKIESFGQEMGSAVLTFSQNEEGYIPESYRKQEETEEALKNFFEGQALPWEEGMFDVYMDRKGSRIKAEARLRRAALGGIVKNAYLDTYDEENIGGYRLCAVYGKSVLSGNICIHIPVGDFGGENLLLPLTEEEEAMFLRELNEGKDLAEPDFERDGFVIQYEQKDGTGSRTVEKGKIPGFVLELVKKQINLYEKGDLKLQFSE